MDNLRLQDVGEIFVNRLGWVQHELEETERVAKAVQRAGSYETLAGNIDQNMNYVRQMYQQLEKSFDKLCEETGYVSEYKQ